MVFACRLVQYLIAPPPDFSPAAKLGGIWPPARSVCTAGGVVPSRVVHIVGRTRKRFGKIKKFGRRASYRGLWTYDRHHSGISTAHYKIFWIQTAVARRLYVILLFLSLITGCYYPGFAIGLARGR